MRSSEMIEPKPVDTTRETALRKGGSWSIKGDRYAFRQILEHDGLHSLRDAELLKCLLDFACPKGSNLSRSESLVEEFGSYSKTLSSSATDLGKFPGLNSHAVAAVKVIYAASVRFLRCQAFDRQWCIRPGYFRAYLNAAMSREAVEQTRVFFFNDKLQLLAEKVLWTGTTNQTPLYVRELAFEGLCLKASKLILVHNHPTGRPDPSQADTSMTLEASLALEEVGMELWDSVIVGNGKIFSFKDVEW